MYLELEKQAHGVQIGRTVLSIELKKEKEAK
jgi:hypothetical protein